jgi:hypothetical protein
MDAVRSFLQQDTTVLVAAAIGAGLLLRARIATVRAGV